MNILLIIPSNSGTIAYVSYNLYKSLLEITDHNVYVVCLGEYSDKGKIFNNCFHFHAIKKKNWKKNILLLKKIKKKYKIDISISTLVNANYWNVLSSVNEYTIGIFHTRLSQTKSRGFLFYTIQYVLNKLIASNLNKKIAVNKSAYEDTKKLIGGNVELVYNIHDFTKINALSKEDLSDNEKQIYSRPVILFVGSGNPILKAPERLIKAYSTIKSKLFEYNVVFVGEWDSENQSILNSMLKTEGLEDKVYFLGYQMNPYKYMKKASLLVSTSRDEGLPGVLIEALSLGVRCVCTNSTQGVWEIMECDDQYDSQLNDLFETKYGYIVPNKMNDESYTIQKIGEGILRCLHSQSLKLNDFNKKRFSAEHVVPHFLQN